MPSPSTSGPTWSAASPARSPASGSKRSQLDDLLAHVFTAVLIPEFEQDIQEGKDDLKQRWVVDLKADPYNLFKMLGEGEQRQSNMDKIRRRTLRYLLHKHPDVDQRIAHVLITYCFVAREDRKRVLLTWLSGQDVDQAEAKDLGLDTSWVKIDETSADVVDPAAAGGAGPPGDQDHRHPLDLLPAAHPGLRPT